MGRHRQRRVSRHLPGVRVVEGAECLPADDRNPPASYCYTNHVAREVYDPETTEALLSIIGEIVDIGARAVVAASHHKEHHRDDRHRRRR